MLSHPNIVKYYTCWFEESIEDSFYEESMILSSDNTLKSQSELISISNSSCSAKNLSFFIQMEFCENKTLSEFLEKIKGPIGGFVAFKMFTDLLRGLNEIHKNHIIHRDLK